MRKVFCETLGTELSLPEQCQKVVSLSPAATEAIYELGLSDLLVGVSTYCVHPKDWRKKLPVLGAYKNIKENLLARLNPDLIITTTGYQREFALELSRKYNVYAFALPPTVSAIISASAELGVVLGFPEKATKLSKTFTKQLGNLTEARPLNVYIEIDLGGPVTFGKYSYITDACRWLGIKNVFADKNAEWLTPTPEQIARKNIDLIIYEPKMFSKKRRSILEVKAFFQKRGLGNLPAVQQEKIVLTPSLYDFIAHHGPGFIRNVMPWLKKITEGISE